MQLSHDRVSQWPARWAVEIDLEPDAGGDAMPAALRADGALLERSAEAVAVLAAEPEFGTSRRLE